MSLYEEETFLPNSSESITLQTQTRPRPSLFYGSPAIVTGVIPNSVCFFGNR